MWQLFECILIDRYVTKQRPLLNSFGKMQKVLTSLADFLSTMAFLCCHYIFDHIYCHYSFILLYMCTSIRINFLCDYILEQ